ncbi:SH3 domain-containing protein [Paraburkholderia sp.]|uniref:SH3 domain-containing protein n=1 Tax=Paraburkholderia sp. TaxID=1926495 RepID=UPI00345CF9A2
MYKSQTMRTRALAVAVVLAGFGLAAPRAFAQVQAYTSEPVELFAGPSGDYPVVSELGPGVPVTVMGCVSDYSWCDVALPDLRGWVYAAYLSYPYQGGYVPLEDYGPSIGLPVVTFALGAYWGSFYRDRPWYGDRDRWAHRPQPGYGGRPYGGPPRMHGEPPRGEERRAMPGAGGPPPMRGEPPRGAERRAMPEAGGPPPMHGEPPRGAERRAMPEAGGSPPGMHRPPEPQFNGARPSAPPPGAARPQVQGPQYGGRPPEPPAGAYGHPPAGQPYGGQRAPGPAPGAARPERPQGAPQGGHPSGDANSGRRDYRQQN